ncbi:hypothetical protein L593_00645 [Salinarchaeum sp. Harcht-Bsk1]|uniref:hypothetical protein n=1 Tax=Salinarchaeum sp. Harcht-Bsk1 TaxID=1333523 RepID=UPI0003423F7F|nr:hypothetical protein [Salinarchaeum sp. Harcht-Bsk1]AGN00084.1 hypothetical protein L593_00645 [Salinarchaeum sp. Harcht-Bsk1]
MAPTVGDLRNEIRLAVDRFERPDSAGFTKESLAAICEAVDYEIDHDDYPPTSQMRAGILSSIGELESDDPEAVGSSFRKAELEAIADALDADS